MLNNMKNENTYVTRDDKDNEPIFEIQMEFQHLYLDKNMADMDTNLVMVDNFYHDLNK
jgi:hypothetical protein